MLGGLRVVQTSDDAWARRVRDGTAILDLDVGEHPLSALQYSLKGSLFYRCGVLLLGSMACVFMVHVIGGVQLGIISDTESILYRAATGGTSGSSLAVLAVPTVVCY